MPSAAGGTRPVACPKTEGADHAPTCRTGLRGGIPTVNRDQCPTIAYGLVGQHRPELCPTGAGDCACQGTIPDHARDVQVLTSDYIESTDQVCAYLVQKIPPRVGHPSLGAGH